MTHVFPDPPVGDAAYDAFLEKGALKNVPWKYHSAPHRLHLPAGAGFFGKDCVTSLNPWLVASR